VPGNTKGLWLCVDFLTSQHTIQKAFLQLLSTCKNVVSELGCSTRNAPVHFAALGTLAELSCHLEAVVSIHRLYPGFTLQDESQN